MQGDFEKKVQGKMEELKLTPSAPVWEKIELEIRPDKRRRRGLFWIPFIVVFLTAAGWWMFLDKEKVKTTEAASKMNGSAKHPNQTVTFAPEKKVTENNISSTLITKAPVQKQLAFKPLKKNRVHEKAGSNLHYLRSRNPSVKAAEISQEKAILTKQPESGFIEQQPLTKEITTNAERENPEKSSPLSTQDSAVKESLPIEEKPVLPVKADSANHQKKKGASANGWKKIVSLQKGWSKFPSSYTGVARFANSPTLPNSAGSNYGPNEVKSGGAFALAAGLSKAITKQLELSFGLQYSYYSTSIKVGAYRRLDTAVTFSGAGMTLDSYYGNGSQNSYTNRYHVLEIPVSVAVQPFQQFPLQLSIGGSVGRLLQSNALTYNPATNFYYHNRENLTFLYSNFFSSLQYSFINRSKVSISFGPMVQYNLNSFQKENGNSQQRLLIAGFKTAIKF